MRFSSSLFLLFVLLNSGIAQERYVVLVSMDGFRWDYPSLYHTPNLDRIAKKGVKAKSLIPSFPSVTFPNHYTIVTGLYPDHHGLVNNNFYDSTLQMSYSITNRKAVEDKRFYGGEPIWNTAGKQGLKTASYFWVGSETPINDMQPTYWKKYDAKISFESRIDTVIKWLSLPHKDRPRLVLLYFSEPDHVSHTFGPVNKNTKKVVEHMDSLIGELTKKLKKTPNSKNTDLIIVSDHGMGAIEESKNIVIDTYITKDWCKQIEGYNPFYTILPEPGYEDSILHKLKGEEHLHIWRKTEVPSYLNYGSNPRIFPILVLADSSYSLTWSYKKIEKGGAHGYDFRNSDMHGIFYAIGPDFKRNLTTAPFQNIQIYNIIAKLLQLNPAQNDGNLSTVKHILK